MSFVETWRFHNIFDRGWPPIEFWGWHFCVVKCPRRHLRAHGPWNLSFGLQNCDYRVLFFSNQPFLLGEDRLEFKLLLSLAWVGFQGALLEILDAVGDMLLGSDEPLGSSFAKTGASELGVGGSFRANANQCNAWREIVSFGISFLYLYTVPDLFVKNGFDILEFFDLCL